MTTAIDDPSRVASATRSRRTIRVRRPAFELSPDLPRYWCRGEPFATHFMNALSSVFPDGEAFFVRAVSRHADVVARDGSAELAAAVRAFAAQEGRHSREHDLHLALLTQQGYPAIARRNRILDKVLRWSNRRMPIFSLAATAGLEHLTALLARQVLTRGDVTDGMDARMRPLWQWHALEEAEHKAVAFDVLTLVHPRNRLLRAYMLVSNTFGLALEVLDRVVYMLWKDGELLRAKTWRDGWRFLFGRRDAAGGEGRGILRGLGADYRAWFRTDFHPDDVDDRALIERWQAVFADSVVRESDDRRLPVAPGTTTSREPAGPSRRGTSG